MPAEKTAARNPDGKKRLKIWRREAGPGSLDKTGGYRRRYCHRGQYVDRHPRNAAAAAMKPNVYCTWKKPCTSVSSDRMRQSIRFPKPSDEARARTERPAPPHRELIFLGPTGVGKTELAPRIGRVHVGSGRRLDPPRYVGIYGKASRYRDCGRASRLCRL